MKQEIWGNFVMEFHRIDIHAESQSGSFQKDRRRKVKSSLDSGKQAKEGVVRGP